MYKLSRRGFLRTAGALLATLLDSGCRVHERPEIASADFYVSPEGSDQWSGTRAAPNAQRSDGPFCSLARARDAVRDKVRGGMTADVTVLLRGGRYYLEDVLIFDARDSGRDGHRVIYCAYPGERPELIGGQLVQTWAHHKGEIYKTTLDAGATYVLFENGLRAVQARHPNDAYTHVRQMAHNAAQTQFGFDPDDIPHIADPGHLQVYVFPGGPSGEWNWFSDIISVAEVDWDTHMITLVHPARYVLGAGSRYFIQGSLDLLDTPGEFFLDRTSNTLYYWPREAPIEAQDILVASTRRILSFVGTSISPVRDITIEGLWLRVSNAPEQAGSFSTANDSATENEGAIFIEHAAGIAIRNCQISNTGLHGLLIQGVAQGCEVSGNHVFDIGHTGVQVNGPWHSKNRVNGMHTILNNHIHDTGKVIGHGAGIQLVNSGENSIIHNCVHHTSRYAISLKSPRPGILIGQRIEGNDVTAENAKDFAHSRDNEIAYNDLSHANLDTQDSGVFESWGGGLGNHVHHNRIHHSNIPFSFGFGLYLDDAADGFTVSHNLLHDLQRDKDADGMLNAVFMTKGVDNVVKNNVAADNLSLAVASTFEMADEANRRLVYEHNIFYRSGVMVYNHINWSEARLLRADANIFYVSEDYTPRISNTAPGLDYWQRQGYEQHSHIVDPRFVDPERRDYRLHPNSPARDMGITEIAFADIGLTADFLYADPTEPLAQLFARVGDAETLIQLSRGERAELVLSGRSPTGYIVDLQTAEVAFTSANPAVATVSRRGVIVAKGTGLTEIHITVTLDEVTLKTVVFVQV